jgi:hypothetical protein
LEEEDLPALDLAALLEALALPAAKVADVVEETMTATTPVEAAELPERLALAAAAGPLVVEPAAESR